MTKCTHLKHAFESVIKLGNIQSTHRTIFLVKMLTYGYNEIKRVHL